MDASDRILAMQRGGLSRDTIAAILDLPPADVQDALADPADDPVLGGGSEPIRRLASDPMTGVEYGPPVGVVQTGSLLAFFGGLSIDGASDPGQGNAPLVPIALAPHTDFLTGFWLYKSADQTFHSVTASGDGLWAQTSIDGNFNLAGLIIPGTLA